MEWVLEDFAPNDLPFRGLPWRHCDQQCRLRHPLVWLLNHRAEFPHPRSPHPSVVRGCSNQRHLRQKAIREGRGKYFLREAPGLLRDPGLSLFQYRADRGRPSSEHPQGVLPAHCSERQRLRPEARVEGHRYLSSAQVGAERGAQTPSVCELQIPGARARGCWGRSVSDNKSRRAVGQEATPPLQRRNHCGVVTRFR